MRQRNALKDYLINLPLRAVFSLTRPLPPRVRARIAGWAGRRALAVLPGVRRRIDANLDIAFPDMGPADRAALMRGYATNAARTAVEMRLSRERIAQAAGIEVTGDEGMAALTAARAEGRGAMIVSGHFGQWEAIRAVMKHRGMETGAIFRQHNNTYFNTDMVPHFERNGRPMFPKGPKGMRSLIKHLRDGGFASILLDQKVWGGEILDFMGAPATTATGMAEIALKYDLPLVPAYGVRLADGVNFRVEFEPPVPHSDPLTMTQALNDSLAAMIRRYPDQWHWPHRRWDLTDPTRDAVDGEA